MKSHPRLQRMTPKPMWNFMKFFYYKIKTVQYRFLGRPKYTGGETLKARKRRIGEGFFEKYCKGKGLDVGYGGDLLCENCRGWDFEDGDAQYLKSIKNREFDFVYSSHTLEHMEKPEIALKNWWRVLKPGGYLIVCIPHRDLYEKKKTLPSNWNKHHKNFFLLDKDEAPDTIGIIPLIKRTLHNYEIVYGKECDEGHTITDPNVHSDGEYSIEIVLKKK